LKVQGFNFFQDALRAIITIINFLFAIFLNIEYLDPILSIVISIIIIISAIKLIKDGIKDLIDVNPINMFILEELKQKIFNLKYVNGVGNLRVRVSRKKLYLEVNLAVEDHISIAHANEITKTIRKMSKERFPNYDVDTLIEMSPLSGEGTVGENVTNLIYSLKSEFPDIIDMRDLNVFRMGEKYFISLVIEVRFDLTLQEAHKVCTKFEIQLKEQAPLISRIVTHIEGKKEQKKLNSEDLICKKIESKVIEEKIKEKILNILKSKPYVKGFHGFELWSVSENYLIEVHVFFDGNLNISIIHDYILELAALIREKININNLEDIILHSEPYKGRTDGIFF
jgi:divalent metal cation (Fe/Co/Zn/Cd) transporter